MITITNIHISPIKTVSATAGLIYFANFVLFDSLALQGIAVYTRPTGGIRLVYPRKKNTDICYPITNELGQKIEDQILDYLQRHELI